MNLFNLTKRSMKVLVDKFGFYKSILFVALLCIATACGNEPPPRVQIDKKEVAKKTPRKAAPKFGPYMRGLILATGMSAQEANSYLAIQKKYLKRIEAVRADDKGKKAKRNAQHMRQMQKEHTALLGKKRTNLARAFDRKWKANH